MTFEELLERVVDPDKRQPLIDVLDTATICKAWFVAHGLTCTAADLVAMTALVLARERDNQSDGG
jgi:hypothetical protein